MIFAIVVALVVLMVAMRVIATVVVAPTTRVIAIVVKVGEATRGWDTIAEDRAGDIGGAGSLVTETGPLVLAVC